MKIINLVSNKDYSSLIFDIAILLVSLTIISLVSLSVFSTTTSDTLLLENFSGESSIYHQGFGNSNQTVITETDWVVDNITVQGSSGSTMSVLDQFLDSDSSGTDIYRNALFIGTGLISTNSFYLGSNSSNGEDSRTGIFIAGENYGVLLETPGLSFNSSFGGINSFAASASGNYQIQQLGQFGTYNTASDAFTQGDIGTLLLVSGGTAGTIGSLNYGSFPQTGQDAFPGETSGWAEGMTDIYFSNYEGQYASSSTVSIPGGEVTIETLFDYLEANLYFDLIDIDE